MAQVKEGVYGSLPTASTDPSGVIGACLFLNRAPYALLDNSLTSTSHTEADSDAEASVQFDSMREYHECEEMIPEGDESEAPDSPPGPSTSSSSVALPRRRTNSNSESSMSRDYFASSSGAVVEELPPASAGGRGRRSYSSDDDEPPAKAIGRAQRHSKGRSRSNSKGDK